jgi:glycosyltransferase involved in cell wall biosynthesis
VFKLTVIICVYNEEECILKAIRSLYANKVYPATEIILIDDCSTNPVTSRLLGLVEKFTCIKLIKSKENLGLSNSRNLGFANATTEYIVPLDADDTLPPNALDYIYKAFTGNKSIDFIVGDYFINDLSKNETTLVRCDDIATNGLIDGKKLTLDWKLLGTSPCKKSTWQKVGCYALKYSYSVQDVDFWIRVIMGNSKGLYLGEPIYNWNKSSSGMNAGFDRLDMIKLLDDHQDFYLLTYPKSFLYNKIFEGFYPYKQREKLIPFGKKYFFNLTFINKLRLLNLYVK